MEKRKIKTKIILLILLSTITIISLVVTIIFINFFLSGLLVIVAVCLTVIVIKINQSLKLDLLENKYDKIYSLRNDPITIKANLISEQAIKKIIETFDLKTHKISNTYDIYYQIINGITKDKKDSTLLVLIIINDQDTPFQDKHLNNDLHTLERDSLRLKKFNNRVFISIKNGALNKENILEANKVLFFKQNFYNFVFINCIYYQNKFYFLHSDNFSPTRYYNFAVEIIKKIISLSQNENS